ncbi:MAG: NADH-quinone oxidoreductase subunit J [Gammaproteobacteria bacterium]|nr:NADH-quinone oxidoreductase subunit J [Pseudomonadales bacterium]MCP5346043.1 NADH-quinone oxidoreductase subunit J [Pseudomonadales bacterium]
MMLLFYLAAAIALISTVAVILQSNVVHALLYLILSLLAVAVIFYTFGAPFAAMLEAIVYAGAIMVLFLFVIMMLNLGKKSVEQERSWLTGKIWIGPVIMAAALLVQLLNVVRQQQAEVAVSQVGVREVGMALFGPYVLAVEIASILLLAGLVGAYHLAKK